MGSERRASRRVQWGGHLRFPDWRGGTFTFVASSVKFGDWVRWWGDHSGEMRRQGYGHDWAEPPAAPFLPHERSANRGDKCHLLRWSLSGDVRGDEPHAHRYPER